MVSEDDRVRAGYEVVASQIRYFSSQFGEVESAFKFDGSRVTEADHYLSRVMGEALAGRCPEDAFLSEELDHGPEPIEVAGGYAWLLDPIDGTNNFARGLRTCSVSLALLKDGNPIYGYIYDHVSGQVIHGGRGRGLWTGSREVERLQGEVSRQSIVATQIFDSEQAMADERELRRLFKLRAMGSSALHMAYAALGVIDGVIAHRVKSWDIAAGMALLEAVGGSTRFFCQEVFPVRSFSAKGDGFSHIAGPPETCDAIEEAIGRACAYRWQG